MADVVMLLSLRTVAEQPLILLVEGVLLFRVSEVSRETAASSGEEKRVDRKGGQVNINWRGKGLQIYRISYRTMRKNGIGKRERQPNSWLEKYCESKK